jgi:excinuclease ABC subunit C
MAEVIKRRYSRLQREEKAFPDLILIDGGKGQLNAALASLHELGVTDQPVISLAKRLDEVFVPGLSDPQNIPRTSSGLRLLQRLRDESHRFAITFHRKLRKKRTIGSVVDKIPGIGEKRRKVLLTHFGSVKNIKAATLDDIKKIPQFPDTLAETVFNFFHPQHKAKGD